MGKAKEPEKPHRLGGAKQVISWAVEEREVLDKGRGVLADAQTSAGKRLGKDLNPTCANCVNLNIHIASDLSYETRMHEFRAEATCELVHGKKSNYRWNRWGGSGLPMNLTCPDGVSGALLSTSGHLPEPVRVPALPDHAVDAARYYGQEVTDVWLDEMANLPEGVCATEPEPVLTDIPETPGGDW